MFKIETHLHTAPVSHCGKIESEEMIRLYNEAGYKTVFVSDHLTRRTFSFFEDVSWEEKAEIFYEGYLRAKAEGEKFGMNVLFSPEISFDKNDYLIYNMTLDFIKKHTELFDLSLEEFYKLAKENGLVIIQAHPLRDGVCYPTLDYVDGIEIINTNPRHENFDEDVKKLLKEGMLVSAGSDAHRYEDVAGAAVLSPNEIKTTEEYLELLRSGKAKLMKKGEII